MSAEITRINPEDSVEMWKHLEGVSLILEKRIKDASSITTALKTIIAFENQASEDSDIKTELRKLDFQNVQNLMCSAMLVLQEVLDTVKAENISMTTISNEKTERDALDKKIRSYLSSLGVVPGNEMDLLAAILEVAKKNPDYSFSGICREVSKCYHIAGSLRVNQDEVRRMIGKLHLHASVPRLPMEFIKYVLANMQ